MRHYTVVQVFACQEGPEHWASGWDGRAVPLGKNVRTEGIRLGETRFEEAKPSLSAMLWECNYHVHFIVLGKVSTE